MKKRMGIVIYLILTFVGGIIYTTQLPDKNSMAETGKVRLIRSYWYEGWEPRRVLSWWVSIGNRPLVVDVVDMAALSEYAKFFDLRLEQSNFILTAYPERLVGLRIKRLTTKDGFWSIYEVEK